jgi:signal transduction histidine kinase
MWQLALITNLLVAVAYAGVTHHIGVHLTRTHQWRHNLLAATVAIFFASCSINHLAHSVRVLLQPEWRSIWSWHMLTVDSLTALFGLWYFYERFRSPKMSRGAALFEDSTVRRRDAMEIQDNVAQGLIAARYALDRGDARAADTAVEAAIGSARRVITELLPTGGMPKLRRSP